MRFSMKKIGEWNIVIKPKTGWFEIDLKEIWHYRDLILMFLKRNFNSSYKQTILGPLWFLITPLMSSTMFTLIFGKIANISTDGVPQFLFYLCSNTCCKSEEPFSSFSMTIMPSILLSHLATTGLSD